MSSELNKNNSHVGRLILELLGRNGKAMCVVDAGTGQTETKESVLKRSIALAKCMRQFGMKPNEVVALNGRNHIDVRIPYYAGLMLGCPIAALDPLFKLGEIKTFFRITKPKLVFCQQDRYDDNVAAAGELGLDTRVVTFEDGEHSFKRFLEEFNGNDAEEFRPTEIDPTKTYAWLMSTSGSTGIPKVAAYLHKPVAEVMLLFMHNPGLSAVEKDQCYLNLARIHWMTAYLLGLRQPLIGGTILQTSGEATTEHVIDMINTYKPVQAMPHPLHMALILRHPKPCDLSCFKSISLCGSRVHREVIEELRKRTDGAVMEFYGQSELLYPVFQSSPAAPLGSCGKKFPFSDIKLIDPDTQEEITESDKTGELWVRNPALDCYYNMPEETKLAFSPDGYYKSGDLLRRDHEGNYYFVDRLKMLMKYKGTHILPMEIEEVIRIHPSVREVVVLSIPDSDRVVGDLPVACVLTNPGYSVTADVIKQLVQDKLSVNKQLYGGVVFLQEFPRTSTGKVALAKLKEIAIQDLKLMKTF